MQTIFNTVTFFQSMFQSLMWQAGKQKPRPRLARALGGLSSIDEGLSGVNGGLSGGDGGWSGGDVTQRSQQKGLS